MTDVCLDSITDHRSDRPRLPSGTLIYVFGTLDGQHVKIGKTRQAVASRRRQHEGSGPGVQELVFLAGVKGTGSDETAIHRYFADHVAPGLRSKEWFHAAEPVVDWVRWLRTRWFVARTEDECSELEAQPSDAWLPAPDRIVVEPPQLELKPWGSLPSTPPITGDDYYTADAIIRAARTAMGGDIDVDPASHPVANRVVRAHTIYTVETRGEQHPWNGRVWLNPPFGEWDVWIPKLLAEWRSGRVESMCVLLATRSLTARSINPMLEECDGICITRGRIPFWGPKATGTPDDGHAIVYFGAAPHRFIRAFSPLGAVFPGLSRNVAAELVEATP